jgi:hypothetical protein
VRCLLNITVYIDKSEKLLILRMQLEVVKAAERPGCVAGRIEKSLVLIEHHVQLNRLMQL